MTWTLVTTLGSKEQAKHRVQTTSVRCKLGKQQQQYSNYRRPHAGLHYWNLYLRLLQSSECGHAGIIIWSITPKRPYRRNCQRSQDASNSLHRSIRRPIRDDSPLCAVA